MNIASPTYLKSFNLFKYTLRILRAELPTILMLSGLNFLPKIIYQLILVLPLGISVTRQIDKTIDLFISLWAIIPMAGIIFITETTLHNRTPLTLKKALHYGFSRWGSVIGTMIIIGLLVLAGIIPLKILSFLIRNRVIFMLITLVIVIEITIYLQFILQNLALRPNPKLSPIKRSWQIVKGQWWQTFGHCLALYIPYILIELGYAAVLEQIMPDLQFLRYLAQEFLSWFIWPISYIYLTLLFIMLEARKGLHPQITSPILTGTETEQPAG